MKRKNIKYDDYINISNIIKIYKKIKRNTKNKKKLELFEDYYCLNIVNIYNLLKYKKYDGGTYNIFKIYEPKERIIMSQDITNKIINHFVSYYYLLPTLNCFIDSNVATRKNKGTSYGIKLLKKYLNEIKNKDFYILKCDIKKYFHNIDHIKLKEILLKKIKDKDIINIVNIIIDSSNKYNVYELNKGLPIGNMTSQILGIYYLSELDHYIKEKLKIKYYIRYMDDFILIHEDKEYLKYCLKKIKEILNEYKLELNNKTIIINKKQGLIFLGYRFIINNKVIIKIPTKNKNKIKRKLNNLKKYNYSKYLLVKQSYKGYLKNIYILK